MPTPRLAILAGLALLMLATCTAQATVTVTSTASAIHGYVSAGGQSSNDARGSAARTGIWGETYELNAQDGDEFGYLFTSGGLDLTLGPSAGVQFGGTAGGGGNLRAGFSSTTRFTVSGSGEPIDYTQSFLNYGAGTVRVAAWLKGPSGAVFTHNDLGSHAEQMTLPVGDYEFTYQIDVNAGANVYTQPIGSGEIVFENPPCPVITEEPADQLAPFEGPASFHVGAQGSGTLTYQWKRNGVALADLPGHRTGTQSPDLVLAGCQLSDQGVYQCVVTAACGSLPSRPAQLALVPGSLPGITSPGYGYDDGLDELQFLYSIQAVSAAPGLSFAWRFENNPLADGPRPDGAYVAGAGTDHLTISNPGPAEYGTYTCVVSNVIGSVTSDAYHLRPGTTGVSVTPTRPGLAFAPPANPLRGSVSLRFSLADAGTVRLSVFEAGGRRVTTLLDQSMAAGEHSVTWNGRDANGRELPAGVVWCALEQNGARVVRPLVIVR